MSFRFEWPEFSGDFIQGAKEQITEALNKGQKPPNIVGDIVVSELYLGTKVGFCIRFPSRMKLRFLAMDKKAPELELLGIDELAPGLTRSRSMYKLLYQGDAHLVLNTHVQVCNACLLASNCRL
jgi:distribution and morphology protein 34